MYIIHVARAQFYLLYLQLYKHVSANAYWWDFFLIVQRLKHKLRNENVFKLFNNQQIYSEQNLFGIKIVRSVCSKILFYQVYAFNLGAILFIYHN